MGPQGPIRLHAWDTGLSVNLTINGCRARARGDGLGGIAQVRGTGAAYESRSKRDHDQKRHVSTVHYLHESLLLAPKPRRVEGCWHDCPIHRGQ